jgi:hypothetical protein
MFEWMKFITHANKHIVKNLMMNEIMFIEKNLITHANDHIVKTLWWMKLGSLMKLDHTNAISHMSTSRIIRIKTIPLSKD